MEKATIVSLGCFSLLITAGCSSYSVTREHEVLRPRILKLHEDQVWENLISAANDDTPLHLHYSDFEGTGNAELQLKYGFNDSDNFSVDPNQKINTTILELDEDGYSAEGNGKTSTTMKVKAQPAVGASATTIFDEYEAFAGEYLKGPKSKLPEDVFKSRKVKLGGKTVYYYVLKGNSKAWRKMVIATTWTNHALAAKKDTAE